MGSRDEGEREETDTKTKRCRMEEAEPGGVVETGRATMESDGDALRLGWGRCRFGYDDERAHSARSSRPLLSFLSVAFFLPLALQPEKGVSVPGGTARSVWRSRLPLGALLEAPSDLISRPGDPM